MGLVAIMSPTQVQAERVQDQALRAANENTPYRPSAVVDALAAKAR